MLSPNRLVLWSLVVGLFLSNAGVTAAQAVPEAAAPLEDAEIVPEQRRQLWDFFSLLQMVGMKCPPIGAPHERCVAQQNGSDEGEGEDDAAGGGDGGGGYGNGNGNDSDTDADTQGSNANVNSASGTGGTGQFSGRDSASGSGFGGANGLGLSAWMLLTAGSVVAALVAVHFGQQKSAPSNKHGMAGSVRRRFGAVTAFADGFIPQKDVEMQQQQEAGGYRLDASNDQVV